MDTSKRFETLLQLQQREGELSQVLGNLTKPPKWFHSEFLKSPKAVRLEAWLVEAIFGEYAGGGKGATQAASFALSHPQRWAAGPCSIPPPTASALYPSTPEIPGATPAPHYLPAPLAGPGGEHIPHVECVSNTLLHVNKWDPEGDAEILICGRPYYQKDVSKLIMNLADYHRQLRLQSTGMGRATQSQPRLLGRD